MAAQEQVRAGLLIDTVSGASELLPDGTAIFVSTCRWPRLFYAAASAAVVLFTALLLAGVTSTSRAGATGLLASAFGTFAVAAGLLLLWARRLHAAYVHARAAGAWHQGVIVFASGDIVVRFARPLRNLDRTIESAFVSRAEVERGCAPHACGVRDFLRLHFVAVDGRQCSLSLCQTELVDPVRAVADYIGEVKARGLGVFS